MAEHGMRYERLAKRLSGAGVEVWAADQRGHGKTADGGMNGPGRGGLLGHCGDRGGHGRVTADIDIVNKTIRERRPGAPLFLMGHSWGSFLAQDYIENFDTGPGGANLAGCILSGTAGPGGLKISLGRVFLAALAAVSGVRSPSRIAQAMSDGPFSKPFRPNRTSHDWLSRDEAEVDRYLQDPYCAALCSAGFYRDLAALLDRVYKPERQEAISKNLPIYLFAGSADPVGDMGKGPTALTRRYMDLGIRDLEFVLYPDARHETLNETNREEVTDDLLAWILKHC